jgi:hypothetical protein
MDGNPKFWSIAQVMNTGHKYQSPTPKVALTVRHRGWWWTVEKGKVDRTKVIAAFASELEAERHARKLMENNDANSQCGDGTESSEVTRVRKRGSGRNR